MTINLDNTKVTLDFIYEDAECGSTGVKTLYKIRFHYTPELGDTISISDHGSEYFSYPARMFTEIGDFLKEQKIIKKVDNKAFKNPQPKIGDLLSPPAKEDSGISSFGNLSVPEIDGETNILSSAQNEQEDILAEEDVLIDEEILNKYSEKIDELSEPEIQEEINENSISEEEVAKQWKLREKMVDRDKTSQRAIRKRT